MKKKHYAGGPKVMVVDDLSPEDIAMLQALYSRSAESAETHLDRIAESGSGNFMSSFYVGYGHKSIADCGSTTVFTEGVSTLAAKAIQDWPLYCGQETSTRYIDMGKQRIEDPVGTVESKAVLDRWMAFYTSNQDRVAEIVRQRHPKREGEADQVYERAVKARTFDILRAFLPAGVTTQLSWHTNLRQAGDHLVLLSKHPSSEIRSTVSAIREMLEEAYPSSGFGTSLASVSGVGKSGGDDAARARDAWEQFVADHYTYPSGIGFPERSESGFRSTLSLGELSKYGELLRTRPRGCVLPHFLTDLGQLSFSFLLDFGSFRDIQRHRNGVCRMPLLTTTYGFESWYLDQLDDELAHAAKDLIEDLKPKIAALSDDPVVLQYYTALGFRVQCQVTYGLPAALYVMEIRSSKTVHPTLRYAVHTHMIQPFVERYPSIALHVDTDSDDWTVRRGEQTIVTKAKR